MENKKVILKKHEEKNVLSGYQWIFSNEINKVEGDPQNGDIVAIINSNNEFLGKGFYNKNSLISVRILSLKDELIDQSFLKNRIQDAFNLRKTLYPEMDIYRLVYSESDFLPGLIIDRYEDIFVIQTFSIGMELRIESIKNILMELFNPKSIIEKNESQLRLLEGLELKTHFLFGSEASKIIEMDNIKYSIDIMKGQKTGFFLDQRENRTFIRKYVKNSSVLDCFCNEGGFSLNAVFGGAKSVKGLDISEYAIQKSRENSVLNRMDQMCEFEVADVFDDLEKQASTEQKYDVVILDPPSFTKSKKHVTNAKKAYKKINSLAMKILNNHGILISSSCSHHIFKSDFLNILSECASKEKYGIQMFEFHSASPDHPILIQMPETKYLKLGIFRISK